MIEGDYGSPVYRLQVGNGSAGDVPRLSATAPGRSAEADTILHVHLVPGAVPGGSSPRPVFAEDAPAGLEGITSAVLLAEPPVV